MKLHSLDLGAGRFSDISVILVIPSSLSVSQLELSIQKLAEAWPQVVLRMNLTRDSFVDDSGNIKGLFKSKPVRRDLRQIFPRLFEGSANNISSSKELEKLAKFRESLKDIVTPRAVTFRSVHLNDACILKLNVQHPLCDATGVHHIVAAVSRVLAGENIEALRVRVDYAAEVNASISAAKTVHDDGIDVAAVLSRQAEYWSRGWLKFVLSGGMLSLPRRNRARNTFFIPGKIIDTWAKNAKQCNISVTRHDLLMAWIQMAALNSAESIALQEESCFSFTMNIERLQARTSQLSNPWIIVPVSVKPRDSWSLVDLPFIAANIRLAIREARNPLIVQGILEAHQNLESSPLIPKHFGRRKANHILVTSWAGLPILEQEFPTAPTPNSAEQQTHPIYGQIQIDPFPAMKSLRLSFPDLLVIWKGRDGGFWLQGDLEMSVWKRISEIES